MKTQIKTNSSRFSHLALALALSTGTVGGMMGFVALTEPAFARTNGGGNGGGGPAGGGEGAANITDPNVRRVQPSTCNGSRDTIDTNKCRYTQPRAVRIVSINGFANCAVVQQMQNVDGKPTEFYCVRPM